MLATKNTPEEKQAKWGAIPYVSSQLKVIWLPRETAAATSCLWCSGVANGQLRVLLHHRLTVALYAEIGRQRDDLLRAMEVKGAEALAEAQYRLAVLDTYAEAVGWTEEEIASAPPWQEGEPVATRSEVEQVEEAIAREATPKLRPRWIPERQEWANG